MTSLQWFLHLNQHRLNAAQQHDQVNNIIQHDSLSNVFELTER